MIIACPECTQPFQVEDGDIAPLVQVECPHCVFRMILDFEAANDASLIEVGMQMAQGYSSEAEYRVAVGGGEVSQASSTPAPRLRPVPEFADEPEVELKTSTWSPVTEPLHRMPPTEPASEAPPTEKPPVRMPRTAEPIEPVVEMEAEPEIDKPPVRIHRATFEPAPEREPVREPAPRPTGRAARPTLIAHSAPPPAVIPPSGVPAMVDEPGTPAPIEREVEVEVELDEDLQPTLPTPDARHSPPHTPPVLTPIARPELEEPALTASDSQSRPILHEANPDAKPDVRKSSVVGTLFKILLLLLLLSVAGVMVWSLIETGNPNPLPLLQEKFGISIPGL